MSGNTVAASMVEWVAGLNRDLISAVEDVGEAAFHQRPGPMAPAMGFHLWHIARWADLFQSRFPTFADGFARLGTRAEIWTERSLADTWEMGEDLGRNATGWGLDDDASSALRLPSRDAVVGYARAAFAGAEEIFGSIEDDELVQPTGNIYGEDEPWLVADHVGWYSGHGARHLGMIEAVKGVLGLRGTVTS